MEKVGKRFRDCAGNSILGAAKRFRDNYGGRLRWSAVVCYLQKATVYGIVASNLGR